MVGVIYQYIDENITQDKARTSKAYHQLQMTYKEIFLNQCAAGLGFKC